jgi:hypothetical protein
MANTNPKINKVYRNVITTLAACCGEPLAQAQAGPALPVDHRGRIAAADARLIQADGLDSESPQKSRPPADALWKSLDRRIRPDQG